MSVILRKVIVGAELALVTVVRDGVCPFEETIRNVRVSNPGSVLKLLATLEIAAMHGLDALHEKQLKALGGGLYEFKEHSAGIRVFGHYDRHRRKCIILHHTWIKAGKVRQQDRAIKKARQEMDALKQLGLLPLE